MRCPPGQVIQEMRIYLDKYHEVHNVSATCTSLLLNGGQPTYLGTTTNNGGKAVESTPISCEFPSIAIGMTGASGTLIDGVGLKCSTFSWRQVAINPPPPPPPVQQFVTVLLDVASTATRTTQELKSAFLKKAPLTSNSSKASPPNTRLNGLQIIKDGSIPLPIIFRSNCRRHEVTGREPS